MNGKATHSDPSAISKAPVVLFGIDSRGIPKAARFSASHAGLAIKAADQLQLRILVGNDPKVAEIAAKLPVGKIHATGKMFVPFIRRELYDKLAAMAPNGKAHATAATAPAASADAAGPKPGGSTPNFPRDWRSVGLGDLLLAQEGPEDGWYAVIVVGASGDMLTLRWRDYPKVRTFDRHRNRLALVYAGPKSTTETAKAAKPAASSKNDKSAADNANSQTLPKDWLEIATGHLVLAKDDGPWESWWEAIPVEKAADGFKLRWRDYPKMPQIVRPRFELALLCPDPV
jgi:hypothetical protein